MNSILVSLIVLGAAIAGSLLGYLLQRLLPDRYLQSETKEIVWLGTGLIATMAALVLGLLVDNAKSSFDDENASFRELALNVVMLDRTLASYGQEAQPAREQLKRTIEQVIESLWPQDPSAESAAIDDVKITAEGHALVESLRKLAPRDDTQTSLKSSAVQLSTDLTRDRWRLSQSSESSLPVPFLVVLALWLALLFGSFGLFAPRNPLAFAAMIVCAASVAGAVFLIVDLDQPFHGIVKISPAALEDALSKLGR